jgi:hypothetical protein
VIAAASRFEGLFDAILTTDAGLTSTSRRIAILGKPDPTKGAVGGKELKPEPMSLRSAVHLLLTALSSSPLHGR